MRTILIRPGDASDVPAVLELLDAAARGLVARGRPGQWGTEPLSAEPERRARISAWARDGGLHLACLSGRPVGALVLGDAPAHLPPAPEPELYVNWLVTDPAYAGGGIGGQLLNRARQLARESGVALLRVDCYAGDDQALVRYYEREGFRRVASFTDERAAGPWPGQLLEHRLPPAPDHGLPPAPDHRLPPASVDGLPPVSGHHLPPPTGNRP
ncbi:GNAT family N-acetyltransferase [Actinoplanes sp. NPDC049599]|uniref:GNAT family N-acetyltransferase n=1 Tax=Actinoplanes sp. NPDC049599 TaxID=3363903 RepID=UPI0037BAF420